MHTSYSVNTTLTLLDPQNQGGLYGGNFGIIWWIYKPHGLASTFGEHMSLMQLLLQYYSHIPLIQNAIQEFGINEELGMLTRLDNNTAGMVWFASSHESKWQWLSDQSKGSINKIYEADVIGWIHDPMMLTFPIQHHRRDDSKMIITWEHNLDRGRWNIHQVSTSIIPWEISGNNTHIQAIIHQWCRHQIRIHCSHQGNPIVGEHIYHKPKTTNFLHLWSIGIDRKALAQCIVIDYKKYE